MSRREQSPTQGNPQLIGLNMWKTLEGFYNADKRRRDSAQMDYPGLNERWTDRSGWRWIVYYVVDTHEFAAQRVDHYDQNYFGLPTRYGNTPIFDPSPVAGSPLDATDRGPVVLLGSLPYIGSTIKEWFNQRLYSKHSWFPTLRSDPMASIADAIMGDTLALTKDPDFMRVMVDRIDTGSRLLGDLFRNPESEAYQLPVLEVNNRIREGTVSYVEEI
jgi:hypothetical protein